MTKIINHSNDLRRINDDLEGYGIWISKENINPKKIYENLKMRLLKDIIVFHSSADPLILTATGIKTIFPLPNFSGVVVINNAFKCILSEQNYD